MKIFRYLFGILLFLYVSDLSGQSYWGLKAGFAVSKLRDTEIGKSAGISFAAVRSFHIYKGASIEIELDVTNKKANYGNIYAHYDISCFLTNVDLNLYITEFPVLFKYKFNITQKIAIAPYFGMGVSQYIGFSRQANRIKEVGDVECNYSFVFDASSTLLNTKSRNYGISIFYDNRYWFDIRYGRDLNSIGHPNGFIVKNKFHSLYMLFGIIL